MKLIAPLIVAELLLTIPTLAIHLTAQVTAAAQEPRLKWWREAIGMFIHRGLYAIPGRGESVQWNEQIPSR